MKTCVPACMLIAMATASNAAPKGFNYDEAKVPEFDLPDPLQDVTDAKSWPARRAEIFTMLEDQMFGKAPAFEKKDLKVTHQAADSPFLGGKAILSQPTLHVAGCKIHLMIVRPVAVDDAVPAFIAYNFGGNHTVHPDPAIAIAGSWVPRVKNNKASEAQRGQSEKRWDISAIIRNGYALVTAYCGDVDPDFHDNFKNGVHANYGKPAPGEWGTIAAWSWGLSRALDYLEDNPAIDATRIAVMGHSRLGKTSLWAGASDTRFALVISNNSGCGGAALSKRRFGETVQRINSSFPHWFCGNFKKYNGKEDELPFDQHMLLCLVAPRPLYIASAEGDRWADPRGEFLAAKGADPVYRLLGTGGLPAESMPPVDKPVHGRIAYHIRSGGHNVTPYDWNQYLAFANKHLKPSRR
ncbi:MAG: acetylxylan esterase [Verrucomicrobiales bacterium]